MKQVNKKDANRCPYCKKVMGVTEGASEIDQDGRCKIWCTYCGKEYSIEDALSQVKDNLETKKSPIEVEYTRQVQVINENLEMIKVAWEKLQKSYKDQLKKNPNDPKGIGRSSDLGHIAQEMVELSEFLTEYVEFRK